MTAAGKSLSIDGTVCITASELIAAHILPPILGRLRRAHPGIEIEIVASNTARDLRRREADIAVRNFTPTQPDLVARKIADRNARLYATPDYLERLGNPTSAADLSRADFFGFDRTDVMIKVCEPWAWSSRRRTSRSSPTTTSCSGSWRSRASGSAS